MENSVPTIVVVDDSSTVRVIFELSVAPLEIELRTFRSAAESMEFLKEHAPAVLFLDIIMPDKDGLTFLQELRRIPIHEHTPVVMISSKDYAQDRIIAKELGAVEFVANPGVPAHE
jgi:CheY-like chemotaxis protein